MTYDPPWAEKKSGSRAARLRGRLATRYGADAPQFRFALGILFRMVSERRKKAGEEDIGVGTSMRGILGVGPRSVVLKLFYVFLYKEEAIEARTIRQKFVLGAFESGEWSPWTVRRLSFLNNRRPRTNYRMKRSAESPRIRGVGP
jgi:hypothetical protein